MVDELEATSTFYDGEGNEVSLPQTGELIAEAVTETAELQAGDGSEPPVDEPPVAVESADSDGYTASNGDWWSRELIESLRLLPEGVPHPSNLYTVARGRHTVNSDHVGPFVEIILVDDENDHYSITYHEVAGTDQFVSVDIVPVEVVETTTVEYRKVV